MSGGSWDYLSGQDALPHSQVMRKAAERLRQLGDVASALECEALRDVLARAERTWAIATDLKAALHDMEWVDSGDSIEEDFREAMVKRDAARAARMRITSVDLTPPAVLVHARDCVAVLDDESDFEHLADAGTCTCGAAPK